MRRDYSLSFSNMKRFFFIVKKPSSNQMASLAMWFLITQRKSVTNAISSIVQLLFQATYSKQHNNAFAFFKFNVQFGQEIFSRNSKLTLRTFQGHVLSALKAMLVPIVEPLMYFCRRIFQIFQTFFFTLFFSALFSTRLFLQKTFFSN